MSDAYDFQRRWVDAGCPSFEAMLDENRRLRAELLKEIDENERVGSERDAARRQRDALAEALEHIAAEPYTHPSISRIARAALAALKGGGK